MSADLNMTVSPAVKKTGEKVIYVRFADESRAAEVVLPEGRLISNTGFTEEEVGQLEDYVRENAKSIKEMVKQVDPMRTFLERVDEKV